MRNKTIQKPIEPVYFNRFAVKFASDHLNESDAKLLTKTVHSINYDLPELILVENLHIDFGFCIIKNKIQPLTILEKLKKLKADVTIELSILDKSSKVLRKVNFSNCRIESVRGLQSFNVSDDGTVTLLSVGLAYKKLKVA